MSDQRTLNRKKINPWAVLHCLIIIAIPILWREIAAGEGKIFGSLVDWSNQHTVLPDLYRQIFFETGDLIPEFISQLGAGVNGFCFSYYGLFSPVFLASYLLPWVSMTDYVIAATVLCVIASGLLIYLWIYRRYRRTGISFVCALLFLLSSPVMYHAHMHIMFINYFPFLILGFFGVDALIEKKKGRMLAACVFLMILTSYFFSLSGIAVLILYYCFRMKESGRKLRERLIPCIGAVITGCMLSALITLPSLAAILSGRDTENSTSALGLSSLWKLILPDLNYSELIYNSYAIGLTCFALIAILFFLFYKKKSTRFLAASVLVVITFPLFQYAFNGGLYVRAKSLIPFLPLVLLLIGEFFNEWSTRWTRQQTEDVLDPNWKKKIYLAFALTGILCVWMVLSQSISINSRGETPISISPRDLLRYSSCFLDLGLTIAMFCASIRLRKQRIFAVMLVLLQCVVVLACNTDVDYLTKDYYEELHSQEKQELASEAVREAEEDGVYYRSADLTAKRYGSNISYGQYFLQTSMYSSVYNRAYQKLLMKELRLSNPSNNPITLTSEENYLFQTFMGVRYVIDKNKLPDGYEEVDTAGDYYLGKNENAFPLGYASDSLLSRSVYDKLDNWDKQCALLQYIIVPDDEADKEGIVERTGTEAGDAGAEEKTGTKERNTGDEKRSSEPEEIRRMLRQMGAESVEIPTLPLKTGILPEKDKDGNEGEEREWYISESEQATTFELDLDMAGKILFLHLRVREMENKAVSITCNGTENRLSAKTNAYPNGNYDFYFVVTGDSLKLTVGSGSCQFLVEEAYLLPLDQMEERVLTYDAFEIDTLNGNEISGTIQALKDEYFVLNIPYDSGFTALVDGKEVEIEKTNSAFMGFALEEGEHEITFVYHAPLYRFGLAVSALGLILFLFGIPVLSGNVSRKGFIDFYERRKS